MSRLGRGLRPPTPSRVAHRMGAASHEAIAAALKAGIRGGADLSAAFPPIMNQGGTETCFAHSLAACMAAACALKGKPLGFVPSPHTIAALVYAKEQRAQRPASGIYAPLEDLGAAMQDAADVVAAWGLAPMGVVIGDTNSDVGEGPYLPASRVGFPEADTLRVIEGSSKLVDGEYQIPVDDSAAETIAAALDASIPVWIGGLVGQAYEALGPNDVAQPTPADDPRSGGHAQAVSGYRVISGTGEIQLRIFGSWGPQFADRGSVWASQPWTRALWQAWPVAVNL